MKFKSEYHRKHYEAWMLQSEHPEWLHKFQNPLFQKSECYPCDEARQIRTAKQDYYNVICLYCPLDWEKQTCLDIESIYREWEEEKDPEKRTIMSELIALKEWKIK